MVLIVLDGVEMPERSRTGTAGYHNVTIVDLDKSLPFKSDKVTLRLRVQDGFIDTVSTDRTGADQFTRIGRPDTLSLGRCHTLARQLAPFRSGVRAESTDPTATDIELTSLLGIDDARSITPESVWTPRSPWDFLRVPIGITERGAPVELDIKESAQGGMGPHGILIGATGSGKSELLRTLVLSIATTHSSEVLNFVLVDFKGGATFAGLDGLPHVSAFITNLADELTLVDRMQDALQGELVRRQELLRACGYSSATEYEKARAGGAELEPFPTLFVVVDEFGELLASKSEFMDLFVMIGRLGRSLGVHLLLASQRLEEGRIHALETHLSYRIGLRMFGASESRSVLGVTDAYDKPLQPGEGYLRTDTTTLVKFKAAYVSGLCKTPERVKTPRRVIEGKVVPYSVGYLAPLSRPEPEPSPADGAGDELEVEGETLLKVIVDRLRDQGLPARTIWLPPLDESPAIDVLLGQLYVDQARGLGIPRNAGGGALRVPIAVVDKPFEQRRDLLLADLAGGKGHVGVIGAPQMGKTNAIKTLITGMALTHTPEETQFYCLDFGGGGLAAISGLPHVGVVASRLDKERVNRTVAELSLLLDSRERRFADLGVESMAAYRKLRAERRVTDDPYGDIFLVVDGWYTLHQEFENLEPNIQELASRGLSYGIHLIVGASRWSEIRPWLRDLLGTKLELRLGDSIDSEIDFRAAKGVPAVPGRGLAPDKSHFLVALPRIDGATSTDDLPEATRALVDAVASHWSGPKALPVRLLPTELDVAELPGPATDGPDLKIAIGLDDQALQPVWHDFGQAPHLMVFGDMETGKSNLLRLVARGIVQRYSPKEAKIVFGDTRRQLQTMVPPEYVLGQAYVQDALGDLAKEVRGALQKRIPGPEITPDRLPKRDWWKGPQLFMLIDDYELMTAPLKSSLEPLVDVVANGAEIGLHLIITRSSANGMRGMTDPMLRRMWDTGTNGVLLSARKEEGAFLGDARCKTLPPGRAQLVNRRRGITIVQTGLVPLPETTEG